MNSDVSQPGSGNYRGGWLGFVLLGAGLLLLLRRMGYDIPEWVFTWPFLIICIGLITAIRRPFPSTTAMILIAIGGLFLARHEGWIPVSVRMLFWPVVLIVVGLLIIFRPKSSGFKTFTYSNKYSNWQDVTNEHNADEKNKQ